MQLKELRGLKLKGFCSTASFNQLDTSYPTQRLNTSKQLTTVSFVSTSSDMLAAPQPYSFSGQQQQPGARREEEDDETYTNVIYARNNETNSEESCDIHPLPKKRKTADFDLPQE